jgi:hypothetical protein
MRSPFGRELEAGTGPGPFAQRPESLLNKALARPFNGRYTRAHGLRNLLIFQVLIRFQQNPSTGQFAPTRFATAAQA